MKPTQWYALYACCCAVLAGMYVEKLLDGTNVTGWTWAAAIASAICVVLNIIDVGRKAS